MVMLPGVVVVDIDRAAGVADDRFAARAYRRRGRRGQRRCGQGRRAGLRLWRSVALRALTGDRVRLVVAGEEKDRDQEESRSAHAVLRILAVWWRTSREWRDSSRASPW